MAGLPFGSPDSKGTLAYLKQGGIIYVSIPASRLPLRKIDLIIDFGIGVKNKIKLSYVDT